jgi:hypothetical protein
VPRIFPATCRSLSSTYWGLLKQPDKQEMPRSSNKR